MALNRKALKTLQAAWIALIAFSTYPVVENIILTKYIMVNKTLHGIYILIGSYYPTSECIGLIVALTFLLPRLKVITKQLKRGEITQNVIKCITKQGVLTAIGNILLIVAQRLTSNPVSIVTMGIIPVAYWVVKDVIDGKEKGFKITVQFLASTLPIVVTICEAWPFSLNGELFTIVLLLARAIIVIRIEDLEKRVAYIDGSFVYAIRQGVTFIVALLIAVPVLSLTHTETEVFHTIGSCFVDPQILGGIIIVMFLSNIAGEWKIFAKATNSVSLVLIMLNAPVVISTFASILAYWALFNTIVPLNTLFIVISILCLAMLILSLLLEQNAKT
jgi:hypothetical protein